MIFFNFSWIFEKVSVVLQNQTNIRYVIYIRSESNF